MIVYHGGTCEIAHPDVTFSKHNLDFGCGFYLTTHRQQAERWARRKAMRLQGKAVLNVYEMSEDWSEFRVLKFGGMSEAWLDYVCDCRRGGIGYKAYDIVLGAVADDDVFQSISLYYRGIWTRERTLQELRFSHPNDQIAVISQRALDICLSLKRTIALEDRA